MIYLRRTAHTVPASAVGVNAGISVHPVVAELDNYEQWRSSQIDLTHSDQTWRVCFRDVASDYAVDDSLLTVSPSTLSESQTILHHDEPRSEGFM